MKSIASALVAWTILASPSMASSPAVRGIKPVGGQRGTDVVVTLSGQRLADTRELLFYQPWIKATKIEAKDGLVTATLRIAPDAPLGLHEFRLRTASGLSALKTFSVGALKDVDEKEPNNDFAKPQPIAMNVTVNGIADNEDADYYAVSAKKGERITAEVEGIRLGLTLFDPYVAILDAKRFEMRSSDDSALVWQDGFVSVVAPEDGTYIVLVRESAYAGNRNCLYRLHVGNFPRPTAIMPSGGKLGEQLSVRWIGDVMGERTTSVTLPATIDRDFGLFASDDLGTAPYPNIFRLSPFGNTMEAEPNNANDKATRFSAPTALNGVIETAGDVDRFVFSAKKGETFDVRVIARQIRSPLDSVLNITSKAGAKVGNNDDTNGPDSVVKFVAPKDDDYILSVRDHLKQGGPDYAYRIEIAPPSRKLTISTPNEAPRRGTPIMAVAVPKGNRQAILINAARNEFGGDLVLSATDLPAGVAFAADTMSAGSNVLPVVFSAQEDAITASSLAKVVGRPTDSSLDVPCAFISTAELVLGQNNVPFWTRTVDALAVAVTEEAPFSIDVVAPKVPIVRGGTMDLKVVATRKPGFTSPIAVSLLWEPPGISSKKDIVIPEGQNEVTIPLNANGGADLRTWKIVVNGTYLEFPTNTTEADRKRGRNAGRLTVSSNLTNFTVASPFLAFKFAAASVEQGKAIDLAVKINTLIDFAGDAKVTLVGLPNKVTTEAATINKDTGDLVFHLKTDATSPPGETKSLFCEVVIMQDGETIVHHLGTGRLRIDAPLPERKTAAPAGPSAPIASKTDDEHPATEAPAKPLSRLEKLRLESQERAKAANALPK